MYSAGLAAAFPVPVAGVVTKIDEATPSEVERAAELLRLAGADKKEAELTQQEREIIESLEHRRWNAYMRSEGYVYSGSKDKASRNDLAKMHHDLVEYQALTEEEKRKDSRIGTN